MEIKYRIESIFFISYYLIFMGQMEYAIMNLNTIIGWCFPIMASSSVRFVCYAKERISDLNLNCSRLMLFKTICLMRNRISCSKIKYYKGTNGLLGKKKGCLVTGQPLITFWLYSNN